MTTRYQTSISALEPISIHIGDTGSTVSHLQEALQTLGYYLDAVDGHYEDKTARAVAKFQRCYGLVASGSYDADTWYALNFWVPEEQGWPARGAATVPNARKTLSQALQLFLPARNKAIS
ncbi:MAG: peptidoglycan-binding domain-containing protein [Elainellaceae cyanobacterium]